MEIYEAISKRRNVHKFKQEKLPEDKLKKILEAGLQSPSGFNAQPWEFVVVTDQPTVKKLAQCKYDHNMQGLLASKVPREEAEKLAGTQRDAFNHCTPVAVLYRKDKPVSMQSTWCCIATIWLAAASEGLGLSPAFFAPHAQDPLKEILGVPESYDIAAIMRIGVPQGTPDRTPRKSLKECLHYNRFGGGQMP